MESAYLRLREGVKGSDILAVPDVYDSNRLNMKASRICSHTHSGHVTSINLWQGTLQEKSSIVSRPSRIPSE